MQLFGTSKKQGGKEGGQPAKQQKKPGLNDIKRQGEHWLQLALHYQTTIIALAVALLLAFTALRMLRYTDPPVDDNQVQQNLSKFKQVRINPKLVQKIEQLQDSGASAAPNLEGGRTNPFSE